MVRTPCCKAEGVKKGAWTPEEDLKLVAYIRQHGEGGWRTLPEKAGLKRCGKSCRLRWANYLRPDIKRGQFSAEEEESIIKLHEVHGNKWSAIARKLPGRTDNEIKNHWNTHIKKRLIRKGIDPATHELISENSSEKNSSDETRGNKDEEEKSENSETKKVSTAPFSGSVRLLNQVASKFGLKIGQSMLTEIIEGGGGPRNNNSSDSTTKSPSIRSTSSGCEIISSSSSLNKMENSKPTMFRSVVSSQENEENPRARFGHSFSFEDSVSVSSTSINGPLMSCLDTPTNDFHGSSMESQVISDDIDSMEILYNLPSIPISSDNRPLDFSDLLGISNEEKYMEASVMENSGFMKDLEDILLDDCHESGNVVPIVSEESQQRAFDDVDSCWNDYMDLQNYSLLDCPTS